MLVEHFILHIGAIFLPSKWGEDSGLGSLFVNVMPGNLVAQDDLYLNFGVLANHSTIYENHKRENGTICT